jgi:PAS domain S-box-containing protein
LPRKNQGAGHALKHSGRQLDLLVDSIDEYAIFMLDLRGRVATWNRGAERLKGYTAAEIIGRHFSTFYTDEDIATGKPARVLAVAESLGRYAEEGARVRKDGTRFWASVVITPVRDEEGLLVGFAKVTRDVTQRRGSEELLRQGEERFRLIVENIHDYAIFMLDPEGNVLSWNIGAERTKGYRAREIVGRHVSLFYTPEDRAADKPERALKIAGTEGRYVEEGWRVRKDGSRFWASVIITRLLHQDGHLLGFAKVTRDLSDRRRAELALLHAKDELEEANADLQAFSASVAHDLRAPLRAIVGSAHILGERLADTAGPEEVRLLERIGLAARRMDSLTDGLLMLSRVTRGDLVVAELDLTALAAEVIDDLRASEPGRAVEYVAPARLVARGDRDLLRAVLQNLLENAWKFSRPATQPRIELGVAKHEGGAAYFVRDNGVGFDMAHVDDIFKPFQRLHSAEQFEGSGIGLATAQRAIRRHGGQLWAESSPNGGAVFWFSLGVETELAAEPLRVG